MRQPKPAEPKHLTASQAAALLQVSPKTVSRWAKEGKLPFVRTLGGHRRYPDSEIRALVDSLSERPTADGDQGSGTRSADICQLNTTPSRGSHASTRPQSSRSPCGPFS